MAFQVSPGINISEIDLTTTVPALATTVGAIAGNFSWGPVGKFILVDSEVTLANRYGKATNNNYETFFSAANFLAYGNALYVSRAAVTSGNTAALGAAGLRGDQYIIATGTSTGVQADMAVTGSGIPEGVTVSSVSSSNLVATFVANSQGVAANGFISNASHSFVNGEPVKYLVAAGNTAVTGLANNTTYYVRNANSSGFYLAATYGDTPITLGSVGNESGHTLTRTGVTRITLSSAASTGNSTIVSAQGVNFFDATLAFNAVANSSTIHPANTLVKNADDFETKGYSNALFTGTEFIARYPGELGNSLKVSVCDTVAQYSRSVDVANGETYGLDGTYDITGITSAALTIAVNSTTANVNINRGAATLTDVRQAVDTLKALISVGDFVELGNTSIGFQTLKVASVGDRADDGTNVFFPITFESTWNRAANFSGATFARKWEYFNTVSAAPGTSLTAANTNANASVVDQISVVVVDEDGKFTGAPGTVLEVYQNLSRSTDAKNDDGTTAFYKTVINDNSRYVWATGDRTGAASATAASVAPSTAATPYTKSFTQGRDGTTESTIPVSALANAYDLFADPTSVDVSLIIQGKARGTTGDNYAQLANYLIDNIAEQRKDCMVFISPDKNDVVGTGVENQQASNVVAFRNSVRNTSYAVIDSGYKYQYDKYSDVYRYIPLNGDIAGLTARSDDLRDPWFSPAGFTRGQLRNLVKLAWNPTKNDRDLLYKSDVNPVVTFPGQGTVLFGDKTALGRSSAFDRINVRRLFIILEKTIATASNSTLFEFNDEFTRAQFRNLVEPFLRDVQGRRGIYDFRVVCDETNNTAEVIDSNRFVGDIYIKPAKSINYIQLNFVAVRSGVEFNEVVGQF